VDCGEHALLPAVRAAESDTAIVADGFSCRTRTAETTERQARHVAELMAAARERPKPGMAAHAVRLGAPAPAVAGAGLAAAVTRRR
jgi:hypothetical protein